MNGRFLIPANSKKSMLIFGLFKPNELIMFGVCLGITILGLISLPTGNTIVAILTLMPALIGGFLVMPVPHYHNVLTVIQSALTFFNTRQKFIWKGWCFLHESDEK